MNRALPLVAPTRWTPELLHAVAEGERRALAPVLASPAADAPAEAATLALARALELVRAALAREPPAAPIACAKGCASCCAAKVVVTAPEALRIAEHLRRSLAPEDLARLTARVRDVDARTRGLSRLARLEARIPCPLLAADGSCSVHEVRPLMCAGWLALDARACEAYAAAPAGRPSAPVYALAHELTGAVLAGLALAAGDAGLDGSLLELVAALRIALDRPTAGERWRRRLPVFALARDDAEPIR